MKTYIKQHLVAVASTARSHGDAGVRSGDKPSEQLHA